MSRRPQGEPPEAGSLAFAFVALVVVCMGLGYVVDRWLSTGPWVMVGGVFVGAGLGFAYLVFILFTTSSGGKSQKDRGADDSGKGADHDGGA